MADSSPNRKALRSTGAILVVRIDASAVPSSQRDEKSQPLSAPARRSR
jgi:hypothetical protein